MRQILILAFFIIGFGLCAQPTPQLLSTTGVGDNLVVGGNKINSNFTNLFNSNEYNLLSYGGVADSDGTNGTDNTAALVAAIAAIPVSGSGVIYIPSSTNGKGYRFASTVTIPKNVKLIGDGPKNMTYFSMTSTPIYAGSQFYYSDDDTPAFTLTTGGANNQYPFMHFKDIALKCTATTPISGSAGISVTGAISGIVMEDVTIEGFYINVDIVAGYRTNINRSLLLGPIQYGIRWKNTTAGDIGWLRVTNTDIVSRATASQHATAAMYMQGAGAVWIDNVDVNAQATLDTTTYFRSGFIADFSNSQTSEIKMNNCNITNYLKRGVWITSTVNSPSQIQVNNSQFAPQAANTYPAIEITGVSGHPMFAVEVSNIVGQNTPGTTQPFCKFDWINGLRVDNIVQRQSTNWSGGDVVISNSTDISKPMKVQSVNSVSPTSPNRTITIEIDGTTYYIAAKTTNN